MEEGRPTNIFVHVEGDNILERNDALLVELNQFFVHSERSRALKYVSLYTSYPTSRQSHHKVAIRTTVVFVDLLRDILGSKISDRVAVFFDDEFHFLEKTRV